MVISWSFLKSFESCPYQQKLIRIDKLGPAKRNVRRFIAGTVGHKFFEIWVKRGFDRKFIPNYAGSIFDGFIDKEFVKWQSELDRIAVRKKVIKEATLLIEAVRVNEIDKISNLQIESHLTKALPKGDHTVGGIVDIIANSGSWIIEMKMSADTKWADPDQLHFYGLLLASIQRRYPTRLSFFLPLSKNSRDQLFDLKFTSNDFSNIYKRIKRVAEMIDSDSFPAVKDPTVCCLCEVKKFCNF